MRPAGIYTGIQQIELYIYIFSCVKAAGYKGRRRRHNNGAGREHPTQRRGDTPHSGEDTPCREEALRSGVFEKNLLPGKCGCFVYVALYSVQEQTNNM